MIEKTVNKVYQVVTVILIISAWGLCLFPPIFGGMVGFAILLCLTIKMFIGKFISKVKGTAGSMLPGQSSDEEPKPTGGAAGLASKANIWALIIDYLTMPMNDLEKGALMFGWIIFPFLFFLVPVMILMLMKDTCSYFDVNLCAIIWG
ncbi:MAG: hypothetical protein UT86_C0005G0014 [Candidatus Magasanikbacteria bacterium GW2011_GWC2_40_17]|uniref:Uncharacterized protein n=1 Tax=Candidatus Magasanikbacteria bacterium GW2011_GWA2_42_32 TaxID=1619039 RepID=A0A0G1A6U9_9BACT|nr:MAG: hypothetical protein UT86_C0005G0014 [Candidatus Magasanikbacteria bacterium GW2011_GWC2_40_17]KKS56750.1 MAG: hypothetical protein UV20_C0006G0033 [Candidatus Magasanikbacteria bacterium GW2011_GWA2_42_32]OGH86061.1 MAG: hypothetical protein A2294_02250 [Candidatus Magasanikbacteria bacterium RIFOXYB2_FULL_38_10]